MKDNTIKFLSVVLGILLCSTLFLVLGIWNEDSTDLPCYDRRSHLIEGVKCSGTTNVVMDRFFILVLFAVIIGIPLILFPFMAEDYCESIRKIGTKK